MKKLILRTAAFLLAAALLYPAGASAVSARKAVLLDAQTGRVLFSRCPDDRSLIASTTKIMTALVVCEQCNVLDRVRIPKEAVGIEGSSIYLKEGEVLTVQELLYGMMLHSGNDAATALAIYCGGTVEGFAELMNDKARKLGLKNSHFVNPHGLDAPEHYSTAMDLALLAAAAMDNPIFVRTVSAKTVTIGNRPLRNHNKLLWQVEGADGVKTGFTKAAGRILVSSANRQGRRLVCVTIDDGNDWADHKKLLHEGFSRYRPYKLVSAGQCLGLVSVAGGQEESVRLIAQEDFYYPLAEGETPQLKLSIKSFVYAPVVEGSEAGFAYICLEGKAVGKVPLVFEKTVEQQAQEEHSFWDNIFRRRQRG